MPEIPRGLTGIAKRKFSELAKELSQMKVITPHDSHLLTHVAKEFELLAILEKTLKKDGHFHYGKRTETTFSKKGDGEDEIKVKETIQHTKFASHPALTARNQCWSNIMKGLQECGLTPSTRSKLKVVKKEDSNPFSNFLTGS